MASQQVNRPTNKSLKEKDVNQKLQLYGILTAFQNGKVPSNEQIDVALNSFVNKSFMKNPSRKLSPEGQGLVHDFRDVVEQAKYLVLTKNSGNLLQDFTWQTQNISGAGAAVPGAPVDKETAKQHGNEALEGLRTLGTLIISNGQFRKLLSDATTLLREIAGDAASKAATKVAPSEEQRAQIDRPAADNTWHDTPDMSAGNIKKQFRSAVDKNAPLSKQDVRDAAGNAAQTAHPGDSSDPRDAARLAAQDQAHGGASGVDAGSGAQQGIDTLRDRVSENVDDETKDRARDVKQATKERTKNYLSSKMPEERREQTIWRLKKMIVEIQEHPDYSSAINALLNLAETYASHANDVAQQGTDAVRYAHADTALKSAESDLKELIERCANYTSTDDLFDAINEVYRDADRDPELKDWFKRTDSYIRKCLQQQSYILEDRATDEWNQLQDQGNFLLRDRYRNHTDRVVDEIKFLGDQFEQDRMNRQFADSCQKLFNDLGNDKNGKPTFKPHLVKDLSEVILPAILEDTRYIPIPRLEYSDHMVDAVIENLVIESDNLMPNAVEFASDNYFRWGRKNIANRNKNSLMISVTGVQMDLRDVSYYVKRKTGFPRLTDLGVADILLYGSGFSFKLNVSTADVKDRQNFFKVDKVDVDVRNFNIKLKQSKHKMLFGLFKPLMLKVMRPALQKVIEKLIREKFHELDQLAYSVKQEADRAQAEMMKDPSQAENVYSRYASAAQKKVMQGKKKTEEFAADKKVNVAMTQQDSIFPDIKLPGGISSKATEYKELAAKGTTWESPIFSIGSAGKTSNIPTVGEVKRKHHNVASGGIRDPRNIGQTASMSGVQHSTRQGSGQNGNADTTNGHPNGNGDASAFSNQVDQAFSKIPQGQNGTMLGQTNPVFTGSEHANT